MSPAAAPCVAPFLAAAERELTASGPPSLSDEDLVAVMTAAVRLYAARAEDAAVPMSPVDLASLSTTAVLTTACEMIRAINVNMFDVSMWFARTER